MINENVAVYEDRSASAIFDNEQEATLAVSELRAAGIEDDSLSVIARQGRTTTTRDGAGHVTDEEQTKWFRGILGGGALGAGLGVAALAIPGVGPLVAGGAIAAALVPEAVAIGAAAGAAAGTLNETLKSHVSEADAGYYSEHLGKGGVLVVVSGEGIDREQARRILARNGGHSSAQARQIA
ncbi:hypothetical protein [Polymorphobacter sp.]|uniref:hypothetical protein n=1 Tax=Polymorphobacter sp. TaxID=1909290 RepID=UPI003F6F93B9